MKRGSKKSPIQPKTKEQLANEIKRAGQRTMIKDKFYPALVEATISVDEASQLLSAANALIMEEAMEKLRSTRMQEIKGRLVKKLCPDDERLLQIEKLLSIFDDMTLFDTRGHFESMKAVVMQLQIDEMRSRKLDTMKPDWNRYLN